MSGFRLFLGLIALPAALLLVSPPLVIAGPQQDRMRSCNVEAKEKALKGDERRSFMSSCLSSGTSKTRALATEEAQALKDRKKQCRTEAKDKSLKGDERKAFIVECVKA